MKFRTEVKIKEQLNLINHQHKITSIGSCFATHIHTHLTQCQFNTVNHSFGILFNPVSIAKMIRNTFSRAINENLIVSRDEHFYHYDYHSVIGTKTKAGLIEFIKKQQAEFALEFESSNRLILTFGTAWVYRLISENEIVANCHKIPQKEFEKELLNLDELKVLYTTLFQDIKAANPALEIIVTVSPVRHVKNGLHENNLSKSILLLLTDFLEKTFDFVHYFPAYELVIDDLRDYRFYKSDLIHPSEQAIAYVIAFFQETYFTERTSKITGLCLKLAQLKNHKHQHPSVDQINLKKEQEKALIKSISQLKIKL